MVPIANRLYPVYPSVVCVICFGANAKAADRHCTMESEISQGKTTIKRNRNQQIDLNLFRCTSCQLDFQEIPRFTYVKPQIYVSKS
jgi:hypothetical protein